MPEWLVRLKGDKSDLGYLPSLLRSAGHAIIEENGVYYLKSSDFDSLDSADAARERGIAIIKMLNGAMRLCVRSFAGVGEDGVTVIEEDGRRRHFVYGSVSMQGRSRLRADATVLASDGAEQIEQALPSNLESWLSLANTDWAVADALHFFRENTWVSLYKVYEIIRKDAGGEPAMVRNGWAATEELNRFRQTAQSRAALGDFARHALRELRPPSQPMTIQEAESLLREVMLNWLSSKA